MAAERLACLCSLATKVNQRCRRAGHSSTPQPRGETSHADTTEHRKSTLAIEHALRSSRPASRAFEAAHTDTCPQLPNPDCGPETIAGSQVQFFDGACRWPLACIPLPCTRGLLTDAESLWKPATRLGTIERLHG